MYPDVAELRVFYSSAAGQWVQRLISGKLERIWPHARRMRVVGIGYCAPYLPYLRPEALNVAAFMRARQGFIAWPDVPPYSCSLIDEHNIPLPDGAIDRLMIVHGLEPSEQASLFMAECWRILSPRGRLLIIVANRRSLWAQVEATPFGHGRPYSRNQLNAALTEAAFEPVHWDFALHGWPTRGALKRAEFRGETVGTRLWPGFGGVIICEAVKRPTRSAVNIGGPARLRPQMQNSG